MLFYIHHFICWQFSIPLAIDNLNAFNEDSTMRSIIIYCTIENHARIAYMMFIYNIPRVSRQ